MFPIALDLTRIPVLLIGSGGLLARRRKQLEEAGATRATIIEFNDYKVNEATISLADFSIILVAGIPRPDAERIATQARALGKLINVEDVNDLCDFYFTANVRRGDLLIAISTSGASPTLARKIRDVIARLFGEEWAERIHEMAVLRQSWKKQGASFQELIDNTEQHLAQKGWLSSSPSPLAGEGRGEGHSFIETTPSLTIPHQGGVNKKEEEAI